MANNAHAARAYAKRIENSRCREVERASSRLATLTQAISSTSETAGVIASLGLVHLMSSLLFGVKPTDLPTFALVVLVLCAIGLLACYLPARRAMRIDPVIALREE